MASQIEGGLTGARRWPWRAIGWAAVAALLTIVIHVLDPLGKILLVAFAGLLLGNFLAGIGDGLHARAHLPRWLGVIVAVAIVIAPLVLIGWLLVPRVIDQVTALQSELPRAASAIDGWLRERSWGEALLARAPSPTEVLAPESVLRGARRLVSSIVTVLGAVAVIVFVGLYTAAEPGVYEAGVVRLAPKHHRERVCEVLHEIRHKLWWWIVGRLVSMAIIGVLTTIALSLLGIPLALALGVIAGLLQFIPNIGPVISVVPAVVLAAPLGATKILWVLALYAAIQTLESYVITPVIQRKAAAVPPALLLVAQVVFGLWFGILGVLFATPVTAIVLVVTRTLWVEDALGDRPDEHEEEAEEPAPEASSAPSSAPRPSMA